jgi:hypothetical protein
MRERQQAMQFVRVGAGRPPKKRGFLKRLLRACLDLMRRRFRRGEEVEEPTLPTIEF